MFPAVWKFQEDLAIAWNNEADIQNRLGHSAAALTSNTNALAIRNGLVDLDPDNIDMEKRKKQSLNCDRQLN